MPAHIKLNPVPNNQERIDYLNLVLNKDSSRLELITSHRSRILAHALVTYAAGFGATLKFLPNANPWLMATSLFVLALCFFLADFQLHRYQHGWVGTMNIHLEVLVSVINNPEREVEFKSYYKEKEKKAYKSWKEWVSFNRFVYYLLFMGSICAGVILAKGWVG